MSAVTTGDGLDNVPTITITSIITSMLCRPIGGNYGKKQINRKLVER